MYDGPKIIAGILVFCGLALFPFWYTAASGQESARPVLSKPVKTGPCIAEKGVMNATHMDFLNTWRDLVVRSGKRMTQTTDGQQLEMSLTNTCLDCHGAKEQFCDSCHTYLGVNPYCWDCHNQPKGK